MDLSPARRARRPAAHRHHPGGRDHQRRQSRPGLLDRYLAGGRGVGPPPPQFRGPERGMADPTGAARRGHRLDLWRGRHRGDHRHSRGCLPDSAPAQQHRHQRRAHPRGYARGRFSPIRDRERERVSVGFDRIGRLQRNGQAGLPADGEIQDRDDGER